jgi:serine/threonine protein phosphatase 1
MVGDIHGAYDLVWQAIKASGMDPTRDVILSVGDLADRGKGSHRCAKFLSLPYVKAVRGNHEQMYIDLYENGLPDPAMLEFLGATNFNGMGWIKELTEEQRQEILTAFKALPIAIEVTTERGKIGLVHADVPQGMSWNTFLERLEENDQYVIDFATGMLDESRRRVESRRTDGVQGIDRLFVGHTVQKGGMVRYGNVVAIDSGAVFGEAGKMPGAHLTFFNGVAGTQLLTAPRLPQMLDLSLVDVRGANDIPTHPFSPLLDQDEDGDSPRLSP